MATRKSRSVSCGLAGAAAVAAVTGMSDGEGGAGWSRSARTVTVHSAYVHRFVEQGARGLPVPAP